MSCNSIAFGLFSIGCESTNKFVGISDTIIENISRTMTTTENRVVTRLDVDQSILLRADSIDCTNLLLTNRVDASVVVNQEIDEQGRVDIINAISQNTEWEAIQNNEQITGFFNNPANSQRNDIEIANYFQGLTENTLTLDRLNTITTGMRVNQDIVLDVNELKGTNCTLSNDIMVKVFVSQVLYAVLEVFQSGTYDLETTNIIKQSLRREQSGLFGGGKKAKKGYLILGVLAIGVLVIGGVFVFMMSRKKGQSPTQQMDIPTDVPTQSPTQSYRQSPLLPTNVPSRSNTVSFGRPSVSFGRPSVNPLYPVQSGSMSQSPGVNRPLYRQRSSQPSTE